MGDLEKRLAKALKDKAEALEQQTATADILRVIASSPSNLQAVLDAVAERAARLCEATDVLIHLVDGQMLPIAASVGAFAATYPAGERFPLTRGSVVGRAVMERKTIHVHDLAVESDDEFPVAKEFQRRHGHRTVLTTPLMREGVPLGAIWIRRTEVRPFTDKQIKLLETFADQAVIAIENVRLFNETKEALEQQTATSEILRVISSSPTDVQPVFNTVVQSGLRLLGGYSATMMLLRDDDRLDLVAYTSTSAEADASLIHAFPLPLRRIPTGERAVHERHAHAVEDIESAPDATDVMRETGRARGWRSNLFVPMIRENVAVGLISITRREPGPFAADQIALLEIFAAQAVIAIENVRLFNALESANRGLEAASRHKSEFLANMSHELRTPLNAVIGFSEVLSERMFGDLNEKQEEYLRDIHASGQHLLSLINDILDLSKIEAGRMELERTDFDLPTALDNALTLIRERAGRRGITLHLSVDERLGQLRADERKIRQVVLNVLSNAIKFTPEGGRIEVAAVPRDEFVEVSVSDTGVGIAPEEQEAVFEEFRQVGTAAKKVEGTGLGLALSRKFIELHGGRIWVQSQVGIGSTFTFTIPVQRTDQVIE